MPNLASVYQKGNTKNLKIIQACCFSLTFCYINHLEILNVPYYSIYMGTRIFFAQAIVMNGIDPSLNAYV